MVFDIFPAAGATYTWSFVIGLLDQYQQHRQQKDDREFSQPLIRKSKKGSDRPQVFVITRPHLKWMRVQLTHPENCDGRWLETALSKYLPKGSNKLRAAAYAETFKVMDYRVVPTPKNTRSHLDTNGSLSRT